MSPANRKTALKPRRKCGPRFRRALLEKLEDRSLLTIQLPGVPFWQPQGPAPIVGGQVEGMSEQGNPVAGAVSAIVTPASNGNVVYIGTANGGVWKSENARDLIPLWRP